MRPAVRGGIGLVLMLPYLVWLARVRTWDFVGIDAWGPAVLSGVTQAALSLVVSSLVGLVLFRGLRAVGPAARGRAELRLLAPNALPPLFVGLATLGLGAPLETFPFGLGPVVFAHALMNSGLIAVALERLERARLGRLSEVAWVSGVGEFSFWTRVAAPLLGRDLVTLAFFIFSLGLTSFSIPRLLQGGDAVSLEVLIFDLIRFGGRWDQAVVLAAGQTLALWLLGACVPGAAPLPRPFEPRAVSYPPHRAWGWLTWLPAGLAAAGLTRGLSHAHPNLDPGAVARAALTSASIGASAGATMLVTFIAVAYVSPHARFERFLRGYLGPGPAIVGFAMLFLWGDGWPIARLVSALTLIAFAPLYRWRVDAALTSLRSQWIVARTLGASAGQILVDVTWPQAGPALLEASGLAAAWAAGDFALSGLLLDRADSLPMLITDHLARYEWSTAQALLVPLTLTVGLLYSIYRGMAIYVRR